MAEEQDESQRTEEPTQKRLEDARRRGQVASSREVTSFLLLAATLVAWAALAPVTGSGLTLAMTGFLVEAGTLRLDGSAAGRLLLAALGMGLAAAALPLLLHLAAPLVAAALQGAIVWSTESFGLKLERISPLRGLGRLVSLKSLVEFAKGLVKLAVVTVAMTGTLWSERAGIVAAAEMPLPAMLAYLQSLVLRLLAVATAAVAVIAILDYAHTRFAHRRELRMSRRDVLDEHKQSEGDPIIRQRLKALRLERARRRMMADVPKSTVVITNPTHYAVALRYVAGETAAPQLLAKGTDEVARRIREAAARHGVPIVENPPLARALHGTCELGAMIPPVHYQAVAEIIGYVLRLGGGQR